MEKKPTSEAVDTAFKEADEFIKKAKDPKS